MEAAKNKSLFEKNMEIYVKEKKIDFAFKYKMKDLKEKKLNLNSTKN